MASWRIPHSGSSAVSTSAINELVVGSHPGNPMPAAFRMTCVPHRSRPTISARTD